MCTYFTKELSSFDIKNIYSIADKDKHGKLSKTNWDSFYSIFISPFQSCDVNTDHLLDFREFQDCFKEKFEKKILNSTE